MYGVILMIIELVGFVLPTVIAHYFNNFWIAYILYFIYFILHTLKYPSKYKTWKTKALNQVI